VSKKSLPSQVEPGGPRYSSARQTVVAAATKVGPGPVGPIEHEIQQKLGVDEVCLFSGLNAGGEEGLAVAVQSTRELARSEVEVVVRRYAPFFERVRVRVFSEFPRTETGTRKTRRSVLKKLLFEEMPLST